MITLELSRSEAVKLETFLLVTTKFREGEMEAYKKLADEVDEEGNLLFPHAKGNIEYWAEQCEMMDSIQKRLYQALTAPPIEG